MTNAGDYRVVVTNGYGSVTSLPATLVVNGIGLGGFEGDLMPRPNGNNAVTISDWVEVGLLVVGLDSVLNSSEFMRADCAPRMVGTNLTLGDGRLTVADWTQAGRYAAGLDPVTAAGGPSAPVSGSFAPRLPTQKDNSTRSLQAGTVTVWQGGTIQVPVFLTSQGNENALGFSLGFDPSRLTFRDATAGAGAAGAFMQVNAQNAASGQVGIALANQVGQQFSTGRVEVARLQFTAGSVTGNVAAVFVDQPVFREIVDTRAAPLECAYVDGSVQIILAPRFSGVQAIAGGGISLTISGPAGQGCVLQGSSDLVSWTSLSTNVFTASPLVINDPGAPAHSSRFYRLMPSP